MTPKSYDPATPPVARKPLGAGRLLMGLLLLIPLVWGACKITGVEQPETAAQGEVIEITVDVQETIEDVNEHTPILSIMVPEDWEFVSGTYTSDVGDGELVLSPEWADSTEKIRAADEGMKWIGMLADDAYAYPGASEENPVFGSATIELRVGQTMGDFELGYFLSDTGFANVADIMAFWSEGAADTLFNQPLTVTQGTAAEGRDAVPSRFTLEQNYPNPFNPSTTLRYALAEPAEVTLRVFDAAGREVAAFGEGHRPAGTYEVAFDAGALPSGVYVYQLEAGGTVFARSMVLAK